MSHRTAYRYQFGMPKLVLPGSFAYQEEELKIASLVDDPDLLRKVAGSPVVAEWGDIEPIKNHSLVHLIALGATEYTGCNCNGDGFKQAFCKRSHPSFLEYGALYRDHKSKDYSKRSGDIIKTAWNDDMGRVELLVAAHHDKCADFLADIEAGKRRDVSMGFDCEYDVCEICKHKAKTRKEYCQHVKKNASAPFGMGRVLPDGRRCFVDNPAGVWNDISIVPTGADRIAQHLRKVAGLDDVEVTGSAELAEDFIGTPDTIGKLALAAKLSAMEKIVPVSVFRPADKKLRLEPKVAHALRDASPARMFAQLAQSNVVLDSNSFFQLTMGDKFAEVEQYLPSVTYYSTRLYSILDADQDRLNNVCEMQMYDAAKTAGALLSDRDSVGVRRTYGLDSECVEYSLKTAAISGERIDQSEVLPVNHPVVSALLDEYAAYKLAALLAIGAYDNTPALGVATMIG